MKSSLFSKEIIGWSFYDFANSAFATTILAVIFNRYYAGPVSGGEEGTLILGFQVPGASLFSFIVSFSMFLVAVASPFLGALADFSGRKKRFFFFFFLCGVIFTSGLGTVNEGEIFWGGFLFIFANFGFACSNVFYNSFLVDISTPRTIGRISGFGWGLGYLGGGLLLLLNLVMLKYPELIGFAKGTFTVHHCFLTVAIWWSLFSVPAFLWIKEKPGPVKSLEKSLDYFSIAVQRLATTFRQIKNYRELIRFLISFLIYNDGIQTVIILASIFGAQELGMDDSSLILFFLMIQGTAFIGAIVMGFLADKIGNRTTIIVCLFVWSFIVIWAYFIGLFGDAVREFWVLGILAGLVMGGSQAASRSLAGLMTPPDRAAEFFGFYSVAGKFASIFGPLLYGLIVIISGSLRSGILSLIVFFVAGLLLILRVDEQKGYKEAQNTVD